MKKVFLMAAIAAFSTTSFAQTTFGIQAGANIASAKMEQTESGVTSKLNTDSKTGFLIGAVAEVPFGTSINFRPELNFIQKGFKYSKSTGGLGVSNKTTLNYIELPLNFVYHAEAGAGTVFFGAGPSFGFGISGKSKTTQTGEPDENQDVKFDGKKDADVTDQNVHLKAFDFGVNATAGYKMANGVYLSVGYTFGLANIDPNANSSFKNIGGLSLKLGYMFGGAGSN